MNQTMQNIALVSEGLPKTGRSYRRLHRLAVIALGLVILYLAVSASSFDGFTAALLIVPCAFFPALLWLSGYVQGIPCFALFSLMNVIYYAFPFVISHPAVEQYSATEKLTASMTVSGYLLVSTVVWIFVARSEKKARLSCYAFDAQKYTKYHLLLIGAAIVFAFNSVAWVIDIPYELNSLLRPFISGLSLISVFLLSYRYGSGSLKRREKILFLVLLPLLVLINCVSLLLISSVGMLMSALGGYWLSTRRLPVRAILVILAFLMIFQAGKYDMREKYWDRDGFLMLTPAEYPAYFVEWASSGLGALTGKKAPGESRGGANAGGGVSLFERASLAHMLLLAQTQVPNSVPYFEGDSYVDIPGLLVPRFLAPNKTTIFASMQRLSAHFGILSLDTSERTSIAWGLLPEAYANFGYAGVFGLALVIGLMFGLFARTSRGYSIFSVRGAASIMLMASILGMESHAAAAVSTLFQSLAAVVVAGILFSRKGANTGSEL